MATSSSGYCGNARAFLMLKLNIKVNGPTLPINIVSIIINLENVESLGVIPVVSPTVPKAEVTSKRTCKKVNWCPWLRRIRKVDVKTRINANPNIKIAFLIVEIGIVLPEITIGTLSL